MMTEINIQKMNELIHREGFAEKLQNAGSYENAYRLFSENGVDASYEEFMGLIEDSRKRMQEKEMISQDGELSEEMLELVSGGKWYHSLACWGLAALAFAAGCPEAGLLMVFIGVAAWKA